MKNNSFIWWGGLIILFLVLIFTARVITKPKISSFVESVLVNTEKSDKIFNFGKISMSDGNVNHFFFIKNEGSEPIKIIKVYTSCMCTEANIKIGNGKKIGPFGMHNSSYIDVEVDAGKTIEIEAVFNPNAHGPSGVGPIDRIIFIETNSKIKPKIELRFKGLVIK